MEYSFLIKEENNVIIPNVPNAGIYKNEIGDNFTGKPWGNDYLNKKVEPSAEAYASQFYAKNHIPSSYRPGNNPKPKIYNYVNTDKFNVQCYNY